MSENRLPTEVELVYEVMPCIAMRTGQEPTSQPHSCSYFRRWGTYHSYDYGEEGPPPQPGIVHRSVYVGRAPLVPEVLSGCRKTPILAVGINPNLPGWWGSRRSSVNPLFDDYKQYAHYFRYRSVDKLEIPRDVYEEEYGGGAHDQAVVDVQGTLGTFELDIESDENGQRTIPLQRQPQSMYEAYQDLLESLASRMDWSEHKLTVGEDLAYGNMVACPSAKWQTRPSGDPRLPIMSRSDLRGIVDECFRERKYFLRQLFQSLPSVVLIFSRSTSRAFIGELQDRFILGDPSPDDSLDDLMGRNVRLKYGDLSDGTELTARVIFAPHITGNPQDFGPARQAVVDQLVEEAEAGNLHFNLATRHLHRSRGGCVFCPMLEIGKCDYEDELEPLTDAPRLTADSPTKDLLAEKAAQQALQAATATAAGNSDAHWSLPDDKDASDEEPVVTRFAPVPPTDDTAELPVELLAGEVDEDSGPTFVLRGRVVTMDSQHTVRDDGALVISKGVIRAILAAGEPTPTEFQNAPVVESEGTIYPGLLDLHNHFVYNVLPLWIVPQQYSNRSQWPRHAQYVSDVSTPIRLALAKYADSARAIVRYVESKAVFGGTTTGQGMRTRVAGGFQLFRGAMRNVEQTADPRLPEGRTRVPDLSVGGASGNNNIQSFLGALDDTRARGAAFFYHLAEGRDERARRHFTNLVAHDLLGPSLVGIHALALEREDLDALAAAEAKICWSPFSNMLLYGETLNLGDVRDSGVKLSLGCDWSPSGSKNLLQELKVAAFVNDQQGGVFSDLELVELVTTSAAALAGWQQHVGVLRPQAMADLIVIRGTGGDPYAHLINADEAAVRLVAIHGRARYGDRELVAAIHDGPQTDLELLTIGGRQKALYLHSDTSPINEVSFAAAKRTLAIAMSDLKGFVEEQEALNENLLALGVATPQPFILELDNEIQEFEDDPFVDADDGELELGLTAATIDDMADFLPLDDATVIDADPDYWQRIDAELNIPDELKAYLHETYGT